MTNPHETIRWGHHALALEIALGDGTARLARLGTPGETGADPRPGAPLPLVEVTTPTSGATGRAGTSSTPPSARGCGLRSHRATRDGDWHVLTVELHDRGPG